MIEFARLFPLIHRISST